MKFPFNMTHWIETCKRSALQDVFTDHWYINNNTKFEFHKIQKKQKKNKTSRGYIIKYIRFSLVWLYIDLDSHWWNEFKGLICKKRWFLNVIPILSNTGALGLLDGSDTPPKCQCLTGWEWKSKMNFFLQTGPQRMQMH